MSTILGLIVLSTFLTSIVGIFLPQKVLFFATVKYKTKRFLAFAFYLTLSLVELTLIGAIHRENEFVPWLLFCVFALLLLQTFRVATNKIPNAKW